MKNKEDVTVRERIHDFADKSKKGNLPVDLSYPFEKSSILSLIENSQAVPKSITESSSVIYIEDPSGLSPSDLLGYDIVFNNGESFSNSKTILNNYSNGLETLAHDLNDIFYLGPLDDEKRSKFLMKYVNKSNIYLSNQKFQSILDKFLDLHSLKLSDVKTLVPILFLLKSFDVVHCYGLNYASKVEDDIVFGLHFTGYITLKDLYE